jgi:uncharacterized membrane protein
MRVSASISSSPLTGWRLALLAVTLFSGLLAVFRLAADSLWFDEAATWHTLQAPLAFFLATFTATEVAPPLHFVAMWPWLRLAGDSEFALRLPAALTAMLSVAVLGRWGRRLFGPGPGLLAALLLAAAPFHVRLAQEFRHYAQFSLLMLLSTAALWEAWRRGGRARWVLYGVFTLAACYTHYFAGFFVAGQGVFVLTAAAAQRRAEASPAHWPAAWRNWLITAAAVGAGFSLWLPWMVREHAEYTEWIAGAQALQSPAQQLAHVLQQILLGLNYPGRSGPYWLLLVLAVILAAALRTGRRASSARAPALWLLTAVSLVPVLLAWLVSQLRPIVTSRYLLPMVPPLAALVAAGLWEIRPALGRCLLAGALMAAQARSLYRQDVNPDRPDWRGAAALVQRCQQPGDQLLVAPAYQIYVLEYYLGMNSALLMDSQQFLRAPNAQAALQARLVDVRRLWLIQTARPPYEPWLKERYPFERLPVTLTHVDGVTLYAIAPAAAAGLNACR